MVSFFQRPLLDGEFDPSGGGPVFQFIPSETPFTIAPIVIPDIVEDFGSATGLTEAIENLRERVSSLDVTVTEGVTDVATQTAILAEGIEEAGEAVEDVQAVLDTPGLPSISGFGGLGIGLGLAGVGLLAIVLLGSRR